MMIEKCIMCADGDMAFSFLSFSNNVIPAVECGNCSVSFKYGYEATDCDAETVKAGVIRKYNGMASRILRNPASASGHGRAL